MFHLVSTNQVALNALNLINGFFPYNVSIKNFLRSEFGALELPF